MQASQNFSTDRRALDFEDYVDILRRHKSWILGPLYACIVLSVLVAFLWPDTYVSTAVVRVTPAQVPERFVASALNQMLTERIQSIAQFVLSRNNLQNIIQTYDLYPRERKRQPIEDILDRMRNKDIRVAPVNTQLAANQRISSFPISFSYSNRLLAQKVCSEIVSKLINESNKGQIEIVDATRKLMEDQVAIAKGRLDDIDRKLQDFRLRNPGRLPEERQVSMQQMTAVENRVSGISAAISRVNQEKMFLDLQIRNERDRLQRLLDTIPAGGDVITVRAQNERLAKLEAEIQSAKNTLEAYREMYKDDYPEVRKVKTQLRILQEEREGLVRKEAEAAKNSEKRSSTTKEEQRKKMAGSKEMIDLESQVNQLEAVRKSKDRELEDLNVELVRLNQQSREAQARIGMAPTADYEYSQIMRDYQQAKDEYQLLLMKKGEADRAAQVERNRQGESLELLDQASLPMEPTEPNRAMIIGAGTAAGLLIGLMFAGVREMKDTTLKNLKDVRAYTQLTVLGSVPLLEEDLVVKRRKRLTLLAWTTAILVGLIVMAASYVYYSANRA